MIIDFNYPSCLLSYLAGKGVFTTHNAFINTHSGLASCRLSADRQVRA